VSDDGSGEVRKGKIGGGVEGVELVTIASLALSVLYETSRMRTPRRQGNAKKRREKGKGIARVS
jgi:hypothetical protein